MGEMEEDTMIEEREELMVSPSGGAEPTLRPAHFLKPSVSSIKGSFFELPPSAFCSETAKSNNLSDLPLKVSFKGVRSPIGKWKEWVDRMHSLHQSTWEKAGICEAIINSTYQIRTDREIVYGFASKWCSETNSFVFSWGEATITLEDVMVLGGFSVLGDFVLSPLETEESVKIEEKLWKARRELRQSKYGKASHHGWLNSYMGSGSEIEHEAFLVLWLSRHVFPKSFDLIAGRNVHHIAIHLARGTRVALAPAVLSCLYRDLRLLKDAFVASANGRKTNKKGSDQDDVLVIGLWAPFQLVQIWAYERFPTLCPKPNSTEPGLPRMARWDKVKKSGLDNSSSVIDDSAGECFLWRPYAISAKSLLIHKFYKEREEWVSVDSNMDEEFESYARFLRAGELVGLDCIELYLPHRVAMQFGMDQDLPGHIARFNETPEIAWNNYARPINDGKLYVPSRLFESDVTTRYLEWWKQLKFAPKDATEGINAGNKIPKSSRRSSLTLKQKKVGKCDLVLPCSHPKRKRTISAKSVQKVKHTLGGSAGDRMTCDRKSFQCFKTRTASSLIADNGAGKVTVSQMKQGENPQENEIPMEGLHRPVENAVENREGIRVDEEVSTDSTEAEISNYHASEIPELEARICKLEEVVARLKAEKLGLQKP